MFLPGLVSITFRKLSPSEIVALSVRCGLRGIEWGGDVHVPHGDMERALEVRNLTHAAGLRTAAYGSYYRMGKNTDAFAGIVDTALALETGIIRVWAGTCGSAETTGEDRGRIVADGQRIAALAANAGLKIAVEWHGNTLTDTAESAGTLFREIAHPNFLCYWQPRGALSVEANLLELETARPYAVGWHVFHWEKDGARCPLGDGMDVWRAYFAAAPDLAGRYALLEFVQGDEPEQLMRDAAVLRKILAELSVEKTVAP